MSEIVGDRSESVIQTNSLAVASGGQDFTFSMNATLSAAGATVNFSNTVVPIGFVPTSCTFVNSSATTVSTAPLSVNNVNRNTNVVTELANSLGQFISANANPESIHSFALYSNLGTPETRKALGEGFFQLSTTGASFGGATPSTIACDITGFILD